ncbi:MAG: hypothetical protein ABR599_04685 [Gemmatimonadota bacterium]
MSVTRRALAVVGSLAVLGCSSESELVTSPSESAAGGREAVQAGRFVNMASGGFKFTIPADFNGGIFGGAVDNRLTFQAKRAADGTVTGSFNYEQTDHGTAGVPYTYKGSVTCFRVYDTPVLERFEDIPPMTQNRAKWGGPIEKTNDPTVPVGTFAWFQSIDNGEGAKSPPDLSTLFGLGDEAANEAFCDSPAVPNPRFGPHAVEQGNIQVR